MIRARRRSQPPRQHHRDGRRGASRRRATSDARCATRCQNAFLFGLTGTPINRADKNTFYAFGAKEDEGGYISRYGFEDSIRDGATKPLHFEPRLVELHIDQKAIEDAYRELTAGLTDEDRDKLGKVAAKMAVLVKSPAPIATICADIAQHFKEKVEPNGFGAQVVTFDRQSCLLYKRELDRHLPPETSDIVISVNSGEDEYAPYRRDRDVEEKVLDRFRDPKDPLKIVIVTSKLRIKLTARLRKHASNPKYKALAERLEDLKNRHQQGLLVSIGFLKELLDLAKDVVRLEREIPVEEEIDRGKAALTKLFEEAKNIDEIVRAVRFDGWQNTHARAGSEARTTEDAV